ncbi:chitobiase/beta-hexosaminidase C-terminal domain-containing protein [Paenibacillus sp. UNC451MF]|uniref:chitobiase/beta-hexosaminidase C-terminal domain-containing protein n=1 Tax=Paenibacillus sp. UNC451MF TaxID=1449063 RepID=UPI000491D22B|nr:chitobiase/beta-hexosaminidase C-terminal domain-containing protein [Paenibacillus sp. UNC451MF]
MAMKQKSIYAIGFAVLFIALLAGLMTFHASASTSHWTDGGHADTAWFDNATEYGTYTIDTPAKLAGVAKLVNDGVNRNGIPINGFNGKILEVSQDLDLSAYLWVPIGTQTKPFKGTLIAASGISKEIRGMTVNDNIMYGGFIGYMDGATVGGFKFTGTGSINMPSVTQNVYVGAAVGKMVNNSILYDITNDVSIKIDTSNQVTYVGGIVGQGEGTLSNLKNNAQITASGGDVYAGGVTGSVYGSGAKYVKIWNNGALNATSKANRNVYAGGIIGYSPVSVEMNQDNTIISNTGAVTAIGGLNNYAGGILGKANGLAKFSVNTSNSGAVSIAAPSASGSYAGGLAGSLGTANADVTFNNTGVVTNNGGTNVYTGGLVGYTEGIFSLEKSHVNSVSIAASGKDHVYTGGLIGYATGDFSFKGAAKNTGAIRVSGGALADKPDEAYTGGLIGYAENRALFENASLLAYENSGSITVSGGTGVYTGGIISNRAYARTGNGISNVSSAGDIKVDGISKLYTGGFIGFIPADSSDKTIANATFASDITVNAAASSSGGTVSTGGIVGYLTGGNANINNGSLKQTPAGIVDAAQTYKGGTITSTGGGASTYTGGIAGYVDGGVISDASVGNTKESHVRITSDGFIGGIAGNLKGTVNKATIQYVTATVQTADGFAGGIAGTAQGSIMGATVGDKGDHDSDSVKLAAANGIDRLTAGGIIGRNEGPLTVNDTLVTQIGLLSEAGRTSYNLGAVAGTLTAEAQIGAVGAPVQVKQLEIDVKADNSSVGGAIGINRTPQAFLDIEGVKILVPANAGKIGGAVGVQDTTQENTTNDGSAITAKDITVTAQGNTLEIGGLYGENQKNTPKSNALNVQVNASGTANQVGGIAGKNRGAITNVQADNHQLEVSGEAGEVGGIVGRSEAPDGSASPASISSAWVHAGEATLIQATGGNASIGGIAGYVQNTEIKDVAVDAKLPDYATISVKGANASAGGLAGKIENSKIIGDEVKINANNLFITSATTAESSYFGGIAGYSSKSRIEKIASGSVSLVIGSPNSLVGGMTGYNLSTETTSVILNNNTAALSIKVTPTATSSIIGGIVGINDRRAGDPSSDPGKAVSTIQNSRIVGSILVNAEASVTGGMVGENRSLIANNSISDKISITSDGNSGIVGGLAGRNMESGTLYYTYSNANLIIEGENTLAGGLVGENLGQVTASYVDIAITGNAHGIEGSSVYLGGLAGRNSGAIDKSYSVSKVTANGSYSIVGGLAGEHAAGTITNSYAAKEVIANADHSFAGGLLGRITNGTVTTAYSAGKVTAGDGSYAGGFAGRYDNTNKELLYKAYYVKDVDNDINGDLPDFADGSFLWLNAHARLSTILAATLKDRNYFPGLSGWDFDSTWRYGSLDAEYKYPELIRIANGGGETGGGSDVNANINWYVRDTFAINFEVKSEAELAGLAAIVNGTIPGVPKFSFEGRTIKVMSPIHIQSKQWVPIGINEDSAFQGNFKGNNHLIDGLTLTSTSSYSGLFGVIGQKAIVENIKLEPLSLTGQQFTGVLAGVNKGTVSHISIKLTGGAKISGATVGSLIGKNTGTVATADVSLEGGSRIEATGTNPVAGGLIGDNAFAVNPNVFTFKVTDSSIGSSASNATIGGLIGRQNGDVSGLSMDIASRISTTGTGSIVGGLIGQHVTGKAENIHLAFTEGKLEALGAESTLGGITGQSGSDNPINHTVITAGNTIQHMVGNGVVGGIVGTKEGKGSNFFDLDEVKVDNVMLASSETSEQAILGGVAGKLANTAVRQASVSGSLKAAGDRVTVGGIAGQADDSILYMVDVKSDIDSASRSGEAIVGGVAGLISSKDVNQSFDFSKLAPLYKGIYNANVSAKSIKATGVDNGADMYVGGIAGKNKAASIYHSVTTPAIAVSGGKTADVGGVAGFSSGIIVSTSAHNSIAADSSRVYHVGGFVGRAAGGEIHYSNAAATAGEKIVIASAVTKPGMTPATHVGGFVGMSDNTRFADSFADIPVQVVCDNQDNTIYAGGFAGSLGDADPAGAGAIQRAYAKGVVDVQGITGAYSGGFAGSVDHYEITEAYATGDVVNTGFDTRTGGFAGVVERSAMVKKAYALQSKVETNGVNHATRSYTGGFAGYNDGIIESAYTGTENIKMNVTGANAFKGALIGYNFRDGKVTLSSYLGSLAPFGRSLGTVEAAKAEDDMTSAYGFGKWNFEMDASFLSLNGEGEIVIQNVKQLNGVVTLYNDVNLNYYRLFNRAADVKPSLNKLSLGADISIGDTSWVPFAAFHGELDGKGKSIKGLQGRASGTSAYGFTAENYGKIVNVSFADANLTAGANTGIVAGINHSGAIISGITVSGSVKGDDYTGGITGKNEGAISNVILQSLNVSGADYTGGVAGSNENMISKVTMHDLTVQGANNTGGLTGENKGGLSSVSIQGLTVNGTDFTGGATGNNGGTISDASIQSLTLNGANHIGGLTGANSGSAEQVVVNGTIDAAGSVLGGIAGSNEGKISKAYSRGIIHPKNAGQEALVGGIAGVNGKAGDIRESFSFADISVTSDQATAGGIVGLNQGLIGNTYYSGRVQAKATTKAWAGGIAGHASEGVISDSMNYGEVIAAVGGKIVLGKTFFGGIVGQKEAAAMIKNTAFNKQMLKSDTAYYNANGNRAAGVEGEAAGLLAKDFVQGTLPVSLNTGIWKAAKGFYPQLAAFNGNGASKLSAAAIILGDKDVIHNIKSEFELTQDGELAWTADPREISINSASGSLKGSMNLAGKAILRATVNGDSRELTVNMPVPAFAETAQKPKAITGDNPFNTKTSVALAADEANGIIYYTLNGSQPDQWSQVYTAPIVLTNTTTIKAITMADEKESSEVFSAIWTKQEPEPSRGKGGGGGGWFPPVVSEPAVIAYIGEKAVQTDDLASVTVAKNSKVTLKAPEGQIIYYTTDGSTPTKNSLRYTGELLITRNMTIKMITDQNDQVVTIHYQVENAKFDLKSDVSQMKYISGYENNEFRPDNSLSRYEITDMLAPLLNREDVTVGNLLRDVDSGKQNQIAFFASAGIIDGYPDNTFGGEKGLTRAEFVVVMSRVLKLDINQTGDASLSDVSGHWSEKYINAFTKAGYVEGFPDGTFKPDSEITRAQAVVLINRIIGIKKQDLPEKFSDLPPAHWAFRDIMAAMK